MTWEAIAMKWLNKLFLIQVARTKRVAPTLVLLRHCHWSLQFVCWWGNWSRKVICTWFV